MKDWDELDHQLRQAWELYLQTGEETPLLDLIHAHPEARASCSHEYPFVHRIHDIMLNGEIYRVIRCLHCNERLRFLPKETKNISLTQEGVPYWLTGPALAAWAAQEDPDSSGGPVDWEQYRS